MAGSVLKTYLDRYESSKQKCTAVFEVDNCYEADTVVFHCERNADHEGPHQVSGRVCQAAWTVMWSNHREARGVP